MKHFQPHSQLYTLQVLTAFHVSLILWILIAETGTIVHTVLVLIWILIIYFLILYKKFKKLLLRTVLSIYCHLINNVKIFMGSNWIISKMNITKKLIFLNLYSLIYTHTDHQREYHLLVKTPEHPHSKYYYHWYGCHPFYVINVWYLNLKISGYKNKFSWTFQMSCQLYQLNQISKG